jgi:hypothetical protein
MHNYDWNEMLAEFRALGGTAENICLKDGVYGRGLFPIDPAKPVIVRIPETLLIDTADAGFASGVFYVKPNSKIGAREKSFLETYENGFSWGGCGRSEIERIFEQAQALPKDLRDVLKSEYHCGAWFDDPTDALTQERFINSRCLRYRDRTVVMPITELANHGMGPTYNTVDEIVLAGTFPGEVFAKYAAFDPHGTFVTWGFASEEPQAFSIALGGKVGQSAVQIGRELGLVAPANDFWVPALTKTGGAATLPFLMIGNKRHPKFCKGIFYKLMRDAGLSGFEDAFDTMRHANRMHFLNLLAAIENVEGPMAQTLRRMVRYQLQAMSYCHGVQAF